MEQVNAYKKDQSGYKLKNEVDENQDEVLDDDDDEEEEAQYDENGKKLLTVIEYNTKYTKKPLRSMKLRSEGNRFVKNDQL